MVEIEQNFEMLHVLKLLLYVHIANKNRFNIWNIFLKPFIGTILASTRRKRQQKRRHLSSLDETLNDFVIGIGSKILKLRVKMMRLVRK